MYMYMYMFTHCLYVCLPCAGVSGPHYRDHSSALLHGLPPGTPSASHAGRERRDRKVCPGWGQIGITGRREIHD